MKRPMLQLQIVGLIADVEPVLASLQRLACVQIVPCHVGQREVARDASFIQEEEDLAFLLTRLEALLISLAIPEEAISAPEAPDLAFVRSQLEELGTAVARLSERRDTLLNEQQTLPRYQAIMRKLVPLVPQAAHQPGNVSAVVLVADAHRWVLRDLAAQVSELSEKRYYVVDESIGDGLRAMLIVVPFNDAMALRNLLGQKEIAQMQLPEGFANRPPDETVLALEQRLAAIPAELATVERELARLGALWSRRLLAWRGDLAARQARHAAREMLGGTRHTFVLEGWCPLDDLATVERALAPLLTVHINGIPPAEGVPVPVALVNPRPVRPFESLVRLMAHPRYDGLDPTGLMALFLPLFFGIILGDVGYGAIIFLLATLSLRRFRDPGTMRDVLHILQWGALWGIFFGLLYGEAFGTLGEKLGLHALWLERAAPEYLTALLLFTIALGFVHVTLGLILGVWLSWQQRNRRHLLERGGMLVGLVGLLLLTGALTQIVPRVLAAPGVAVLLLGIVLLSASHGWLGLLLGPIEFVGLLGNILSYLRLAAVGLASVYVALVANELAGALGSIILGIVVAVLIHALNIVLGAFSPTIHSLRLHYVEFFRKFYEGGGHPFQPFGNPGSK